MNDMIFMATIGLNEVTYKGLPKKGSPHVKEGFSNFKNLKVLKNLKLLCLGTLRSGGWYQCEKALPQLLCTISVFR